MPADRVESSSPPNRASAAVLDAIVERIRAGAVFVYPTETIYGIGGLWGFSGIDERIYRIKNRPSGNPFILVADCREHLDCLHVEFSEPAHRLAEAFWPGRLTLVLPAAGAPGGIAVRVSDHPFVQAVCSRLMLPLYSTSANISGQEYVGDPDAIFTIFRDSVDLMIDGGILPVSPPSTVVRVDPSGGVEVLREGAVSAAEVGRALQ
jgi:L-threonylcarbamoyladenylate synthase